MKTLYVKDDQAVFIDTENRFIYDVYVYVWFNGILSLANHKTFCTNTEIRGIIKSYFINKYIEFYTVLYAAPKDWIIDNGFTIFVNTKKKRKKKPTNE